MSFYWILAIIIIAGVFGGIVNFLLPSNEIDKEGIKTKQRKMKETIVLGIAASLLVPLFLEIAQSKILDQVHYSGKFQDRICSSVSAKPDSVVVTVQHQYPKDSLAAHKETIDKLATTVAKISKESACPPLKNYFIFFAYCLVAAAAGVRFITAITDSVLKDKIIESKDKTIETEKQKSKQAEAEKHQAETDAKKQAETTEQFKLENELFANNLQTLKEQVAGATEPVNTLESLQENEKGLSKSLFPLNVPTDIQKGKFGGQATSNFRRLKATVSDTPVAKYFYKFTLTVQSTQPEKHPLTGEVTFYLHQTFKPMERTVKVIDGKAELQDMAYGAFTVGATADNGNTQLELDLSDNALGFPESFRTR